MTHESLEGLRLLLDEAAKDLPIGSSYRHYKDLARTYTVVGFTILEATDEVAVRYVPDYASGVEFTRPLSSFTATVEVDGRTHLRFESAI